MKKAVVIAGLLLFTVFEAMSFASEPPETVDTTSAFSGVSAFAGNVVITLDKGKEITINAMKTVGDENELILKGNVEIKVDNLVFRAEKAAVHTSDDTVLITIKSCEIKNT